jgi:hypothetical protein
MSGVSHHRPAPTLLTHSMTTAGKKKSLPLVQYFLGATVLLAFVLICSSLYLVGSASQPESTLPTRQAFQAVVLSSVEGSPRIYNETVSFHEAQFIYANATYSYRYSSKVFWKQRQQQQQQQQQITSNNQKNHNHLPSIRLVFGICANSQKPIRRQAIRKSWSQDAALAVFIVAGDFNDISKEFWKHGDLLWVNVSESYREGLTPKTLAFVHFGGTQLSVEKKNAYYYDYIFKTDDDVYVNATHIGLELLETKRTAHYYGMYKSGVAPVRDKSDERLAKWYMSRDEYPDDFFPPYAPGVGYALSREFAACAARNMQSIFRNNNMPWEDVAVGLLAAKCRAPLTAADANWPHFSLEPNSNSALDFFPYEEYKDGGRLVTILHKVQPWYFVPLYRQESLVEAKNHVMQMKKEVRTRRQRGGPENKE